MVYLAYYAAERHLQRTHGDEAVADNNNNERKKPEGGNRHKRQAKELLYGTSSIKASCKHNKLK